MWSASFSLAAPVAAHGGSSNIARVAALDQQRAPWLLQLSDGLALRNGDGWHFVCPDAFAASTILHAASADAERAWVVTLRDVYSVSRRGRIVRAGPVCRADTRKLVQHGSRVYALAQDTARGEHVVCVLEAKGAREVYSGAVPIADLASDGEQLWLVRVPVAADGGATLELAALDDDAELVDWQSYALDAVPRAVRVRGAGGSLYATLIDPGSQLLVRLNAGAAELLVESATAISGPVEAGGRAFALANGNLVSLDTQPPEDVATPFVVDGIDGIESDGFALAEGAVYRLPLSDADATFELDEVSPPPASLYSEACAAQWRSFELGLHGGDEAAPAAVPEFRPVAMAESRARLQPSAATPSCAFARTMPAAPVSAWWFVVLVAALLLRRTRCRTDE